jgi:limonene-1,2-epoxide hydrolase
MTNESMQTERRAALTGLGVGALAALMATPAAATDADKSNKDNTAHEKQITDVVTGFCQAWNGKDVEKLIPYVSADIEYHMFEGAPAIKGVDQFRERLGGFMSGMKEINWEIFRSHAIGDIVINERIDHFIQGPGAKRPDNHFHIVGVFLVREGKIVYWKDYNMPAKA